MSRQYLFMCGTPRSGTTFLASVVGSHPDIVMGVERYALRYGERTLLPEHFERERFFDIRPDDTRHTEETVFFRKRKALEEKFDRARFVGDKYPTMTKQFAWLQEAFANPAFILVVRNPVDVARSWAARAAKAADKWPEGNGFEAGLDGWGRSLAKAFRHRQRGGRIVVLDYDLAVSGGADAAIHLDGLFERIGAGPSDAARKRLEARARQEPRPDPTPEELAAVRQRVDGKAWTYLDRLFAGEGLPAPAWREALAS